MPQLNLKPTHKPIKDYYATLQQYQAENITHEGAVSTPFETLLNICAKQTDAIFIPQYGMDTEIGRRIIVDGAIKNNGLFFAYWEAKDIDDDLTQAVQQKRQAGYPFENILFQTPERGILIQNGQTALDLDISDPENLITVLKHLFAWTTPTHEDWHKAVADFRAHVPDLANNLMELIEHRYDTDAGFKKAFTIGVNLALFLSCWRGFQPRFVCFRFKNRGFQPRFVCFRFKNRGFQPRFVCFRFKNRG